MAGSIWEQFLTGLRHTTPLEFIGTIAGIASVWFSRKENILVYPVGLVNTLIYTWLSIKGHLYGEASVNIYYTVVSIYGWMLWARRGENKEHQLKISASNRKDWLQQLLFFFVFYGVLFFSLRWLKTAFAPEAIPWADALASASAYTGMWLMARKKIESWYWWIITNLASIPLYFVKGYVFTSFQFAVLLVLAVAGLLTWIKKYKEQ